MLLLLYEYWGVVGKTFVRSSKKWDHHFSQWDGSDQDSKPWDRADDPISQTAPPFPYSDRFCQSCCCCSKVTEHDLHRAQENSRRIEISGNLFQVRNVPKVFADKETLTHDQSHSSLRANWTNSIIHLKCYILLVVEKIFTFVKMVDTEIIWTSIIENTHNYWITTRSNALD